MAIKLHKSIKREMLAGADTHGKNRGRPIIVELLPGDEISFRAKGTRASYSVHLCQCFRLAQIMTVEASYREAMSAYTIKKKMGQLRLRKPKRPNLPYNNMYFKALTK